jgi:peptidoglycan/LPS O-acetylase OafA/YrhL
MKLPYRPEIDGLRSIAVLSIIFYHAQIIIFGDEFLKGGFVGVDIFFVVSGYLISRILLSELFDEGKINLLHFYERRVRRIVPVLLATFIVSFPFAYNYLLPSQFTEYAQSILSATFFSSNIFFYLTNTQYGAQDSLLQPFLHTWSLGVEEQFYIFFPILILLGYRFFKHHLITIITILILLSLLYAEWMSSQNQQFNFFIIFTRFWELGIGSLLAFYELKYGRVKNNLLNHTLPLLGLSLIAYSIVFFGQQTPHPSLVTLLPTLGTALIILYAGNKVDVVSKFLSLKVIVGIGLISYSLYLWHYILFAFARITDTDGLENYEKYYLILATLILSIISYFLVERPFRNNQFVSAKKFIITIMIALFCITTTNLMVVASDGFINRLPTIFNSDKKSSLDAELRDMIDNDFLYRSQIIKDINGPRRWTFTDNGECIILSQTFNNAFIKKFNSCKKKYTKATIIIGDSHAENLFNIFRLANKNKFLVSVSQDSCRPHGCLQKHNHYRFFLDNFIQHLDKDDLIIYHQSGSYLLQDVNGAVDSQKTFDDDYLKVEYENLDISRKYLNLLAKKTAAKIAWIGPFVEYRFNPKEIVRLPKMEFINKLKINPASIRLFDLLEDKIVIFLNKEGRNFDYLSFDKIYKVNSTAFINSGDSPLCFQFYDRDHFSNCGQKEASKNLEIKAYQLIKR